MNKLNYHNTPNFEEAERYILKKLETEIDHTLYYHGYHHTIDVLNAAMKIADNEGINNEERCLLRIAVAYHDAGFIFTYKDHEEKGCELAKENLPRFSFSDKQIKMICGMIMATKIPQQPKNLLEQIIADADLDYLGREDVNTIADTLFKELKVHTDLKDEQAWHEVQVNFLNSHSYHTNFSRKFRNPGKQKYLQQLLKNG